jgi:hypothetical protein
MQALKCLAAASDYQASAQRTAQVDLACDREASLIQSLGGKRNDQALFAPPKLSRGSVGNCELLDSR